MNGEALKLKTEYRRDMHILFAVSFCLCLIWTFLENRALYAVGSDAELYISIADNFMYTGRFTQSKLPEAVHYILPPGLPVIILLCKLVGGGSGWMCGMKLLALLQYALFSGTVCLIYKLTLGFTGRRWAALLAAAVFLLSDLPSGAEPFWAANTETYYVFLILLAIAVVLDARLPLGTRLTAAAFSTMLAWFIRPACVPFMVFAFAALVLFTVKKRVCLRRCVTVLGTFAVLFLATVAVNYANTGHVVFGIEGYSGTTLYRGNNPDTQTGAFASVLSDEFADGYYTEVVSDASLDIYEKSALLSKAAVRFILKNPLFCARNAAYKGYAMFVYPYGFMAYTSFIAMIALIITRKRQRLALILTAAALSVFILVTSFGLNIGRYAYLMLPVYCVLNTTLLCGVALWIRRLLKPKQPGASTESERHGQ